MMNNVSPHEADTAWLKIGIEFRFGLEPSESDIEKFTEKVAVLMADDFSELQARKVAFNLFWG